MPLTFSKEPTLWLGVLRAGLYMAAHFGLSLSAEQTAAVVMFFEALTVLINRQVVSPVSKPQDPPADPPADDGPPTPRTGTSDPPLAAMAGLGFALLVACSGAQKPQPVGCETLDYGVLSANCGDDTDECNRIIDEHINECAERIRGGE